MKLASINQLSYLSKPSLRADEKENTETETLRDAKQCHIWFKNVHEAPEQV